MRLAAALIYLSSVAHVAAIGHGFPSTKSTSNFIDVNPAPAGGYSILNQFVKKSEVGKPGRRPAHARRIGLGTSPDVLCFRHGRGLGRRLDLDRHTGLIRFATAAASGQQ